MPPNLSGDPSSIPGRRTSHSGESLSPEGHRDDTRPQMMSNLGVNDHSRARHDPRLVTQLGTFIDRMANYNELDAKHRSILHDFKEFVLDMPPTHWRATVSLQATVLQAVQASQSLRDEVHAFKVEAYQANQRARAHFTLSSEQEEEIRALCKAMVFEPHRSDYDIAEKARDTLKDATQYPAFIEAFKSKKGESTVLRYARSEATYARNLFRELLRDSVYDHQDRCSLTVCTRRTAKKLLNSSEVTPEMVINVAILRRFCRERPDILDREEQSSAEEADDNSHQLNTRKGRRKRPRSGEAFWDVVSDFVKSHDREWGKDLRSEGWSKYVNECIQQELRLFPDDRISSIPQLCPPGRMQDSPDSDRFPSRSPTGASSASPHHRSRDLSRPIVPLPRRAQQSHSTSYTSSPARIQSQSPALLSPSISVASPRLPPDLSYSQLPSTHLMHDPVPFGAPLPPLTLSPLPGASSLSSFPDHGHNQHPSSSPLHSSGSPPRPVSTMAFPTSGFLGDDTFPSRLTQDSRLSAAPRATSSDLRRPASGLNHGNISRMEPRSSGASITGMASSHGLSGNGSDFSYGHGLAL